MLISDLTLIASNTRRELLRLEALREVLDEERFMPDIQCEGNHLVVRACNPFSEAVKATRLPCQLEVQFYERILGDTVHRVEYIPDGHAACVYEVALTDEEPTS